jgi:hypothetical protein
VGFDIDGIRLVLRSVWNFARTATGNAWEANETIRATTMRRRRRYRVAPRPAGLYQAYLDELIERNRAKREANPEDEAKEDEYWNNRRHWHAEATKPMKKQAA